jgi:hypothetical protein
MTGSTRITDVCHKCHALTVGERNETDCLTGIGVVAAARTKCRLKTTAEFPNRDRNAAINIYKAGWHTSKGEGARRG